MPVYKDTIRNTWYVKFNYKDWQGTIKQKLKRGFATQREAKAFERDFIAEYNNSPTMKFGTLVNLYMQDKDQQLKPTTMHCKKTLISAHILPYFKEIPINEITTNKIRQWQQELLKTSNNAISSLNIIHGQLTAILNFAVKFYSLPNNPAVKCGRFTTKQEKSKMHFWTIEQFNTFIIHCPEPYCTVIKILFYTGMRVGECLALTSSDIDFQKNTVSISKTYTRIKAVDIIGTPKTTKSKRVIFIPTQLSELIRQHIDKMCLLDDTDRLFTQTSKEMLRRKLVNISKALNLPIIRVHDLRHSHASLLIEQGFSPLLIAERLGHENVQTTMNIYSHLYPDKHSEVAQKLNELTIL